MRFNPRSVSRQAPLRRRARVVCVGAVVEGDVRATADGVEMCDVATRGVQVSGATDVGSEETSTDD